MSNAQNSILLARTRFCISPKLGTPSASNATTSPSRMTSMVGQIGCQRLQLRILAGDITPAARLQPQPAVVDLDQQPIAVELALERVL